MKKSCEDICNIIVAQAESDDDKKRLRKQYSLVGKIFIDRVRNYKVYNQALSLSEKTELMTQWKKHAVSRYEEISYACDEVSLVDKSKRKRDEPNDKSDRPAQKPRLSY